MDGITGDRDAGGFAGARIVVVGGSSGIGLATAQAFAQAGAAVIIAGRDAGRLQEARAACPPSVEAEQVDAGSPTSVTSFFTRLGALDHLVITLTGKQGGGDFRSLSLQSLRQAFDEKFWAHLALAQGALGGLAPTGSITFVTGISARMPNRGGAGFAAVNGALEIMVPTLAMELAPIRVNAVSPGLVETPWWTILPPDERARVFAEVGAKLPVRRIGRPEDVARAVLFVVGNGFVTGSVIECDGGARLK